MKIAIASDHAGFDLKEKLRERLQNKHEIFDFGTYNTTSVDYPDFGFKAAEAVANGDFEYGILICGAGVGMSITANKVKGIRAALCTNKDFALLSRRHNNANVLVLPGRFMSEHFAFDIAETWLNEPFEGGRHQNRLNIIKQYEER
ncbi:MAG: ribose 5-phosphate isomerase B [Candidatus Cloacimonetes bacterium]|nr:ribose 5-phosphate isomerase B [Candidatus Cloacimonadota bacterium]